MRHHKSLEFDASLSKAGAKFEGEPDWIIEQLLKRQKDELVRKWRERETRLEKARQAEQDLEQRATKRRRVDKLAHDDNGFDEREWLLDDDGLDADVDDLTGLSKATKAMLEKVGLIAKPEDIRDENVDDDQVKVN